MNKLIATALLAAVAVSSSACILVIAERKGSGQPATESRELSQFLRVEAAGAVDLEIIHGNAHFIELEGDDNLIPHLETRVDGNRLIIGPPEGEHFRPVLPLKARVVTPEVNAVVLAGSGLVTVDGLDTDAFTVELAGSGEVLLSGDVDDLHIEIAGSGEVDARELHANRARINVAGSGDTTVCAYDELDVEITGSGHVTYYCSPAHVSKRVFGSGELVAR